MTKKLDRVLVNGAWYVLFSSSFAIFGEPNFSDHASCEVALSLLGLKRNRPFRFYNYLLQNPEFFPMLCCHWFSCNVVGSAMYRLSKKLKQLKKAIRGFNKENYSDTEKRVAETHEVMLMQQNQTLSNPTQENAALELET